MRVARAHVMVVLVSCTVALLAWAAPAGAFSLAGVSVTATTPSGPLPGSDPNAAGAHPDFVVRLDFDDSGRGSADSAEGVVMHLAPGIVSYVNHVDRCTAAQFGASSGTPSTCPVGSRVGST